MLHQSPERLNNLPKKLRDGRAHIWIQVYFKSFFSFTVFLLPYGQGGCSVTIRKWSIRIQDFRGRAILGGDKYIEEGQWNRLKIKGTDNLKTATLALAGLAQ